MLLTSNFFLLKYNPTIFRVAQCLLLLIQLSKNKRQFSCYAISFNVQAFVVLARTHKHILGDKDEEEELVEDLQVVQTHNHEIFFFMKVALNAL